MTIDFEDHGETSVLRLAGGLTADHTDALRRACDDRLAGATRNLVLDLVNLQAADSEGLETLLWLDERIAGVGGALRIARPSDTTRTILDVTRLSGRFQMHEDVESAARSLR